MLVLAADTNQPPDSEYPGVRVIRPRLLDDGSETPEHVAKRACPYARLVWAERRRGGKVLSTCEWGYNRSAIVAGLSMRMDGMSVDEVVRRLRRGRPGHQGFIALGTPEYRRALTIGCGR
jgi:protein-tyrosine phosphatase